MKYVVAVTNGQHQLKLVGSSSGDLINTKPKAEKRAERLARKNRGLSYLVIPVHKHL